MHIPSRGREWGINRRTDEDPFMFIASVEPVTFVGVLKTARPARALIGWGASYLKKEIVAQRWGQRSHLQPTQTLTRMKSGELTMTLIVADNRERVGWIVSVGNGVRVRQPALLREAVRQEAEAIAPQPEEVSKINRKKKRRTARTERGRAGGTGLHRMTRTEVLHSGAAFAGPETSKSPVAVAPENLCPSTVHKGEGREVLGLCA